MYMRLYSMCLSLFDLLSMMCPKLINIVLNGRISLFLVAEKFSMVHMHHILFICSSVNRHLGCFRTLAIVVNAAMNIGAQMSLQDSDFISCRYMSRSGIAGWYIVLLFLIY